MCGGIHVGHNVIMMLEKCQCAGHSGYGLSYTEYEYSNLNMPAESPMIRASKSNRRC